MALFNYKSDNTKYPDPKNIFEWILLQIRNLFDAEYQESKARYIKLHRHDGCKFTEKAHIKMIRQMRKSAK